MYHCQQRETHTRTKDIRAYGGLRHTKHLKGGASHSQLSTRYTLTQRANNEFAGRFLPTIGDDVLRRNIPISPSIEYRIDLFRIHFWTIHEIRRSSLCGFSSSSLGVKGYRAHKKSAIPPMTTQGPQASAYCRFLRARGFLVRYHCRVRTPLARSS